MRCLPGRWCIRRARRRVPSCRSMCQYRWRCSGHLTRQVERGWQGASGARRYGPDSEWSRMRTHSTYRCPRAGRPDSGSSASARPRVRRPAGRIAGWRLRAGIRLRQSAAYQARRWRVHRIHPVPAPSSHWRKRLDEQTLLLGHAGHVQHGTTIHQAARCDGHSLLRGALREGAVDHDAMAIGSK